MKKIYFLSDAHLGSWAIEHGRTHERRIVSFLDSIKEEAEAIYLLGDMFDFWYEYRYVVPKGFTRFLGKLSELTDRGIEIHFFTGNHDTWCGNYLKKECGVVLHRDAFLTEISGKEFFLAHGDQYSDESTFRLLRSLFHSPILRKLFSNLHPRWSMPLGLGWAKRSMLKHKLLNDTPFLGEEREPSICFAKDYLTKHPTVDCFIFGHRHYEVDIPLNPHSRCIILGDWIHQFTYVVYDGKTVSIEHYVEGDRKGEK